MKNFLALTVLLASCSGGSPLTPTVATLFATPPPPYLTALGDSITAGAHGGEYVSALAHTLGAQYTNLGIGGETSGPVSFQVPGGVLLSRGGVLNDEVGSIPLQTTIVTLYIGTNDAWLFGQPTYTYALNPQAAVYNYASNIKDIIAGIRGRVPQAQIILADVPNSSWRQINLNESSGLRLVSAQLADGYKAALVATGYPVVDLLCDPGMYDEANFGGPYDPHPVASGFAVIAADFLAQIQHPKAPGNCKYEGT